MKNHLIAALLVLFAATTSHAKIRHGGGDGSSMKLAKKILGAKGEIDGVRAEYRWLGQRFPGCKKSSQSLG